MARRALLVDVTKCVGCGSCVEACQETNGHPVHAAEGFDESTFTYLMDRGDEIFVRRLCMHCEDPSCASVCPVQALKKTAQGPVTYDASRCLGCRYCMMACPFGVPTYEWRSAVPRVRKCEMCSGRAGGPACAEACPAEATTSGDRAALIAEARQRIESDPGTYHESVYGLREAGGTDVLYIGPASPEALGLPAVPDHAMPQLTWRALRHVPDVALFGSVLLGGLFWITKRKHDVALAERCEREEL